MWSPEPGKVLAVFPMALQFKLLVLFVVNETVPVWRRVATESKTKQGLALLMRS